MSPGQPPPPEPPLLSPSPPLPAPHFEDTTYRPVATPSSNLQCNKATHILLNGYYAACKSAVKILT